MNRRRDKGVQLNIFEQEKADHNNVSGIKPRQLKIQYGSYSGNYRRHPVIRLAGKWLSNFDFQIGDTVGIQIEKGRITISKVPIKK